MSNPAEILRNEHQSVLAKLTALEIIFKNLERRNEVSPTLKEISSFFQTRFWTHFEKEEKALFPEFDNFMPRGVGPLAAMLEEHEVLRKTNANMQQAIYSYLEGLDNAETRETIRQYGTHFIEFLRGHIQKENGLLLRMAEMHLNERQNQKVVELFTKIEKETNLDLDSQYTWE